MLNPGDVELVLNPGDVVALIKVEKIPAGPESLSYTQVQGCHGAGAVTEGAPGVGAR